MLYGVSGVGGVNVGVDAYMVYGVGGWHQSFLSRLVLINGAPVGRSSRGHTNTHAPDDDGDDGDDGEDDGEDAGDNDVMLVVVVWRSSCLVYLNIRATWDDSIIRQFLDDKDDQTLTDNNG